MITAIMDIINLFVSQHFTVLAIVACVICFLIFKTRSLLALAIAIKAFWPTADFLWQWLGDLAVIASAIFWGLIVLMWVEIDAVRAARKTGVSTASRAATVASTAVRMIRR